MELRQLEHFVAVAEERHFTRAAELLQISQSGLSASIRSLESELGTELFLRSTRRVELTAAGVALLDESQRTLASAAAARDAVFAVRGVLRGTLSVGVEKCLGNIDVPRELARFRERHPEVPIRLSNAGSIELLEQIASGRLDVAIVALGESVPPSVTIHPLATQGLVLLCHPDHRLAAAEQLAVADLADEIFVGFQSDWAARTVVELAFADAGVPYPVQLEVNDVHTLLDLVEQHLGVAVVPESFAHKRPDRLRAVAVTGENSPTWTVAVALRRQGTPAGLAFLGQLIPVFE